MLKIWDKVRINKKVILETCLEEDFNRYYFEWIYRITQIVNLDKYKYYLNCSCNIRYCEEELIPALTYDL